MTAALSLRNMPYKYLFEIGTGILDLTNNFTLNLVNYLDYDESDSAMYGKKEPSQLNDLLEQPTKWLTSRLDN